MLFHDHLHPVFSATGLGTEGEADEFEEEEEGEEDEDVTFEGDAIQEQRILDVDEYDVIFQHNPRRNLVSDSSVFWWPNLCLHLLIELAHYYYYYYYYYCYYYCCCCSCLSVCVYICMYICMCV